MTLKETRKKYQGKYFKRYGIYYRFIKVCEKFDSTLFPIHTEYADTILRSINKDSTLLVNFDNDTIFDSEYKRITKSEFKKQFNKINQQNLDKK